MTQPRLDFTLMPRDTHVTHPAEIARLGGHNLKILERLQRGPATNRELAAISLKYTARVSDLREAGYDVRCVAQDRKSGFALYELR